LTPIHAPLEASAQAIEGTIERSLVTFILRARDGDPDAMLAGIAPHPPAAVAFVPNDAVRATLGTAWSTPLDGIGLQKLLEDHRLVSLPRGEEDCHQLATPFGTEVDFGTETAPAPVVCHVSAGDSTLRHEKCRSMCMTLVRSSP
jgi:hypothetical protein